MDLTFSHPTPYQGKNGYLIKVWHEELKVSRDFEITHTARLEFYTNDGGAFGIPLLESIGLDPNLTEDEKTTAAEMYKTRFRTVSTKDVFVDADTFEILPKTETGKQPPNSFPQKLLFYNALAADTGEEKTGEVIRVLLLQNMGDMIERRRF